MEIMLNLKWVRKLHSIVFNQPKIQQLKIEKKNCSIVGTNVVDCREQIFRAQLQYELQSSDKLS